MPTAREQDFADQMGRHFVRYYGLPPLTGRVLAWLLICEPPDQSAAELAEALSASRSAIGTAVSTLETLSLVQRTRPPGQRADRVRLHGALSAQALDSTAEYGALRELARQGLELLRDEPPARRARLQEMAAFNDFLLERLPQLAQEWRERRSALHASGELPDLDRPETP
jgi:DNA-binding MarR family transcriptional regulator